MNASSTVHMSSQRRSATGAALVRKGIGLSVGARRGAAAHIGGRIASRGRTALGSVSKRSGT
jgi:hypothetical protein